MGGDHSIKDWEGIARVAVVVVPLPAQGRLNQLLQLSHLIASYRIPVHFVGSASHNRQAKARSISDDPALITFHDFHLDAGPPLLPSASNFPAHLLPVFEAASRLRHPVTRLLRRLASDSSRVVVVHDSLMGSVVQDVNSISNAETYTFHTVSAFALFFYIWELTGKPLQLDPDTRTLLPPPNHGCFSSDFSEFMAKQYAHLSLSSGRLYNTSKTIEHKYISLLQKLPLNKNKKLYAVGPLNPVQPKARTRYHVCLDFLDSQPRDSVLYVSFGTTTSFTNDQITELATGLERSGQRFIWVLSKPDSAAAPEEEVVPTGFEERVGGTGMVVRDWAPQMEILGHVSTGGFLSHCGWNSCMESISVGVPMVAWPMHSDQPKNSVLVTRVLGVGIAVKDWKSGPEEMLTSSAVETAVRRLMASEEGDHMRRRAKELAADLQASVADGGVSRLEMDSFIAHITR